MLIHDHIAARISDPGSTGPSVRFIQDRDFFAFRNTRSILLHKPPSCSSHEIAMESFVQVRAYHQDSFNYSLCIRNTYNVKTYATFVGIVNDVHEPFTTTGSILDYRPFAINKAFTRDEMPLRNLWASHELNLYKTGLPSTLRFDCIACDKSNVHAAIVTSCPGPLTEHVLKDMLTQCHFAYFYFTHANDTGFNAQWYRVFNTRTKHVQLYVGVGANEFGEPGTSCTALPPPLAAADPLALMARAASVCDASRLARTAQSDEFVKRAAQLVSRDVRQLAQQLGIRLLVRHNMRYFMLR